MDVSGATVEQLRFQDGVIVPVTNNDIDLGTSSIKFKNGYFAGDLTVDGNINLGGNITIGDADTDSVTVNADVDSNLIPNTDDAYDLGSAVKEWRNLYLDGTANIDSLVADTADINAGTIDGTTIGATTASSGAFTTITASSTLSVTGNATVGGTLGVTGNQTNTGNLTVNGNTTLGNAATDTVTVTADVASNLIPSADDTYSLGAVGSEWQNLYIDGTAYIDNLTIGTSAGITSVDTDLTSVSASDDTLASAKAIKAYVDSQVTAQDLDFQADSGGALSIDLDSETLTIAGGTGLTTTGSGNTVTVDIDSTVATLTGTQTLTNKTLTTPVISSISNTGILTLPTSTDTLVGKATTDTLTNKTVDSANNTLTLDLSEGTLTGTVTEFNAALTGGDFTTIAGTETLTNKTLTSPTINTPTITSPTVDLSTVTSSGDLAVADGGTGASTAAAARTNLDVDQAGTALALAIALG